ncbi:MAG: alginate O-acetyltransferase AlgX-related protein [Spirochaetota bacterium]
MAKQKQSETSERGDDHAAESRLPAVILASGITLVAVLAFGLFATISNPAATDVPADADVIAGEWAARYQASYEAGLLIQEPATHLWALFRYALFGEGRDGVLVGDDGWLFTTEEFAYYPGEEERIERWIEYVEAVRDALAERDIELVVALVPAKARLYQSRLGRYHYPDYAQDRADRFRQAVRDLGIGVPVLDEALAETASQADHFLRTDTHWSPDGALAVARALEPSISAALADQGSPRTSFDHTRGPEETLEGDLLTFLPLGPFSERFGPEPDRIRPIEISEGQAEDSSTGLFEEVVIPITLVGTSYSAGERWDFASAIKSVVDADVLNVATEGEGPFIPMAEWLTSEAIEESTPDVVVWEIPERYLPVEYEVSLPGE